MSIILDKRRAGVLLHITSLPGHNALGNLGQEAFHFIDFLHYTGITVWQTLPLVIPHANRSPYQSLSAHACNTDLIDIDWFYKRGWLNCSDLSEPSAQTRYDLLTKAYDGFTDLAPSEEKQAFNIFCEKKAFWLEDFALFMALREENSQRCWSEWPEPLRNRDIDALRDTQTRLKKPIEITKFLQYVFFQQWYELKNYAQTRDVLLFGDIPIFVSYNSADVWTHRKNFKLDDQGNMTVVAGVPPDYFSETGQRWGNPHFNWLHLRETGFKWWLDRLTTQLELFDILRIDHFRGLEAAWEIPATEETAINGEWVKAPGKDLLNAIETQFGQVPLVAEDLGIITREVEELRDEFNLPGMKILQFAFGDSQNNPYLPINYTPNCVVYTGTHDNDTTTGWAEKLQDYEKAKIYDYLGHPQLSVTDALIQAALGSVAQLAIIPMQDILQLNSASRMNTPGTCEGNWLWRFQWNQVTPEKSENLKHLTYQFNRHPGT